MVEGDNRTFWLDPSPPTPHPPSLAWISDLGPHFLLFKAPVRSLVRAVPGNDHRAGADGSLSFSSRLVPPRPPRPPQAEMCPGGDFVAVWPSPEAPSRWPPRTWPIRFPPSGCSAAGSGGQRPLGSREEGQEGLAPWVGQRRGPRARVRGRRIRRVEQARLPPCPAMSCGGDASATPVEQICRAGPCGGQRPSAGCSGLTCPRSEAGDFSFVSTQGRPETPLSLTEWGQAGGWGWPRRKPRGSSARPGVKASGLVWGRKCGLWLD